MNLLSFKTDDDIHPFSIKSKRSATVWLISLATLHKKTIGEVSYTFCSDASLLKINQESLHHDYYTDILSFDCSIGDIISGDIYISIDRVEDNARAFNVSFEEELLRVISHGALHFFGYSDSTSQEQQDMRIQENKAIDLYYNLINVPRGTKIYV